MSDPKNLLALQAVDPALDQLERKLATLSEREAHDRVVAAIAELEVLDRTDADEQSKLAAEQKRLEDEVAGLRAKMESETERASQLTSPRELQAIEAELESLGRRADELDDQTLELMEEIEPIADRRAARRAEIDELTATGVNTGEALDTAESELAEGIANRREERESVVATVDPAMIAKYDALRARSGGIVIGELDGDRCTACSLNLPPVEAERLRDEPEGSVVPCECGSALIIR